MKVHAQFYGGSSYAHPYPDCFEQFESLRCAKDVFWRRVNNRDASCPCVDETAEMRVWIGDPIGAYPCDCEWDYTLTVGPRGGVRKERHR